MNAEYSRAYDQLCRYHWWWRARQRMLLQEIASICAPTQTYRILDVGCGPAVMFDALSRYGTVCGLEPDPYLVSLSGRWRDSICIGSLDESFPRDRKFDVILMGDVLEHIPDHVLALRIARELLAPGGHLLIAVPAFQWLWTRHDVLNEHCRRYSAAALKRAAEEAGLDVISTRFLFQALVFAKLIVRAKEALVAGAPGPPRIPVEPLNTVAEGLCWLEYLSVGRWCRFGSSLFAVCRPK